MSTPFKTLYPLSTALQQLKKINEILICLLVSVICWSCQNTTATRTVAVPKPLIDATGVTLRSDTLHPPRIVDLDTMPTPVVITVPTSNRSMTLSNGQRINLSAPEKRLAGFSSVMTTFSTEQGLYGLISKVYCDKKGNLWFGTDGGGVIRYDGKTYTTYTAAQGLGSNTVRSIVEDNSGNMWFGTDGGGASRFDGKYFTTFTSKNGLGNNNVWCSLVDRSGFVWFGTDGGGACCYDGNKFITYNTDRGLANNVVKCMATDKNGDLWLGTDGGGATKFDGQHFTTYNKDNGLPGNSIRSIYCDKQGDLWFGTYDNGVSMFNGVNFVSYNTVQGLGNNTVLSIAQDRNNCMWFGTNGKGVSRFDGKTFTTFSTTEGLCNNTVLSIACDKTGNLWFGTYGGGASLYTGEAFTTYSTAQGLSNNQVFSIAEDNNGDMWFGTAVNGINRYDALSFTTYATGQGLLNSQAVTMIKDKKGNLWVGTYGGGLSCYNGKTMVTYIKRQGLGSDNIMCSYADTSGNIWIGTDGGGLSEFDGKRIVTYTTAQGLANNSIMCIGADKLGRLWLGTNGSGISCWNGRNFTTYTGVDGLCNNKIYCTVCDTGGNMWFGTDGGGICRFDGKSFLTYNGTHGLCNSVVFGLAVDAKGQIWVGTNEGLCGLTGYIQESPASQANENNSPRIIPASNKYSNNDLELQYAPVFKTYSFKNGYPIKDINENALFVNSKGAIWIGTSDKLVCFKPDYLAERMDTPQLYLGALRIDNETICWSDLMERRRLNDLNYHFADSMATITEEINDFGNRLSDTKVDTLLRTYSDIVFDSVSNYYPIPSGLKLPYNHNNVTFDFGVIETSRPFALKYQFMLKNYDKDWSPAGNKTTASFGNIREGTYTFMVRAQNPDGIWSAPLTYEFKVLPPFYRNPLAYLFYVVLVLITFVGLIRSRTAILRKEKEKLEHIVADRTSQLVREKAEVEKQRQQSDKLLLNILPEEVAAELKETGTAKARYFDNVTVMFTDFVNFTAISEKMTPQELIDELHNCFKEFDAIIAKYHLEKIKTIGDAYLAVAGLPLPDTQHAEHAVLAAKDIVRFMQRRMKEKGEHTFGIRIGIHTGDLVAGIVGVTKFAYDIWGDTVNTAARMEQSSTTGKINISQNTYDLIKDEIHCTFRGEIEAKNKGKLNMYFVD